MLFITRACHCAAATAASELPSSFVSLRNAPSFVHPPEQDAIGKSVKATPENWVTAYVTPEVISHAEEQALLAFSEPWFSRLDFNDAHADGLIHHYKEFYRSYDEVIQWTRDGAAAEAAAAAAAAGAPSGEACTLSHTPLANVALPTDQLKLAQDALTRVRGLAQRYLPKIPIDDRVHFLRLAGSGFIRSHVDENRNSSGIIAGLCLNAGRVMTLTHPKHPGERVELLLAPRCMYTIFGRARYDWEHSVDWIKDDDEHILRIKKSLVVEGTPIEFDGTTLPLKRYDRTAVIFRGVSPMHLLASRMQAKRHQT